MTLLLFLGGREPRWLSGRASDGRQRGPQFDSHDHRVLALRRVTFEKGHFHLPKIP